jgi:hypothetical protein
MIKIYKKNKFRMFLSEKAKSLNPLVYGTPINEQEIMSYERWNVLNESKGKKKNTSGASFETWAEWRTWINMSGAELKSFYDSTLGKQAGMKQKAANKMGIDTGRESARWLMKMIPTGSSWGSALKNWTPAMWKWAKKQNSFNARMYGTSKRAKGNPWYEERMIDGKKKKVPTRILLALKIWGHNPEKKRRSKPAPPKNLDPIYK